MKIKHMLIVLLGACFLCTSFTGTAQASKWGDVLGKIFSGSGSGSSSSYKSVRVLGKIVDGDQVPISGILIKFESDKGGSWSTHTDENGNYRLNLPGDQNGNINLSGEEWRTFRGRFWTGTADETVFNMTMHHDYITGKVIDRYDNPMHWVKLTFEAYGGNKGVVTVYTDEDGNYKATLPEDGQYWVTVSQDGYKTYREQPYLNGGGVRNYRLYEE